MIRLAEHIKDNTHISSTRESHDKVVLKLLEVVLPSQSSLSSTKLAPLFTFPFSFHGMLTMTYIFENKVKLPLKVPN